MALESRVKCTFEDCNLTFPTVKAMQKHKMLAVEHEYCSRCDEDFPDENHYIYHKLQSSRHIACHVCGEEFKSEGGKDAHIKQFHRDDQEIACPGCGDIFTRAAALMSHIERDDCRVLGVEKYKANRVKKQVIKAALKQVLGASSSSHLITGATCSGSGASDNEGGGVSLVDFLSETDQEKMQRTANDAIEEAIGKMRLQSKHEFDASPQDSKIQHGTEERPFTGEATRTHGNGEEKQDSQAPSPARPNELASDSKNVDPYEDLMQFTEASRCPPVTTPVRTAARPNADLLFEFSPNQEPSSPGSVARNESRRNYVSDWGKVRETVAPRESPVATVTGGLLLDADRFYNSVLGMYVCACDQTFKTAIELERHIASGVHAAGVVRCPSCFRIFKTHTALVAHIESATTRCYIKESMNFGQLMDDISGGLIETAGYNTDGSVRFGPGSMKNQATKKELDLDKVAW
ncbi:hypothetical protein VTO42DRAFT_3059 [Malbranchea cinnamomea]